MRSVFIFFLITATRYCFAQENQYKDQRSSGAEDSACIKKANAMIRQVKNVGDQCRYNLNEDFLTVMTPADSTRKEILIRILNLGEASNIEVEVVAMKWQGQDNEGHDAFITINNPFKVPLPSDFTLPRCGGMSFKQKALLHNNILYSHITYMKLAIYSDSKEILIELGKPQ
ncbi:MAG: hypothetical protein J7578_22420 [Chitinophagaceae bacterium]|nr:hypothetical protein [Chitinophagaceae bacterium]